MDHLLNLALRQRLLFRRDKIAATLRNLAIQKVDLGKKTVAHDNTMEPISATLLDSLDGWYRKELNDVDKALARIRDSHFGFCLGCNSEIDPRQLEKCPEAEFCQSCENLKKWMELG